MRPLVIVSISPSRSCVVSLAGVFVGQDSPRSLFLPVKRMTSSSLQDDEAGEGERSFFGESREDDGISCLSASHGVPGTLLSGGREHDVWGFVEAKACEADAFGVVFCGDWGGLRSVIPSPVAWSVSTGRSPSWKGSLAPELVKATGFFLSLLSGVQCARDLREVCRASSLRLKLC